MREVSDAIKEGASAFVRKQYTTIGYLAIGAAILIFVLYQFGLKDSQCHESDDRVCDRRGGILNRRYHRHVYLGAVEYPHGFGGNEQV